MKYVFVNPLDLIATLVTAGEITVEQLQVAINTKRTLNYPCGFNYNEHNQSYGLFFHTDKETKKVKWAGKDKNCIQLNIQPNQRAPKKDQAAQTLGQALPQGVAGVPQLTAAQAAQLQGVLAGFAAQAPAPATNEADFASLNDQPKL